MKNPLITLSQPIAISTHMTTLMTTQLIQNSGYSDVGVKIMLALINYDGDGFKMVMVLRCW